MILFKDYLIIGDLYWLQKPERRKAMFIHILRKDLVRKKTMNFILLVFIILATMFLASSVNNLITISTSLDVFMETSNVPDFFTVSVGKEGEDPVGDYLMESEYVKEFQILDSFNLPNDQIEIIKRAADQGSSEGGADSEIQEKYQRTNILVLSTVPDNFMKVFAADGAPVELAPGEIALSGLEAEANHLQPGDQLKIRVQDVEKVFTVKTIFRDVVFGNSMMGFKRLCISDEDFQEMRDQEDLYLTRITNVDVTDMKDFQKGFRQNNFKVLANIEKPLVKMCYVFDMMIAGILTIVSICLICFAFLILRFTIVFTLQEDYKEIGIMKAIGIPDRSIKGIYLVKYLVISVAGAAIGLVASIPFGQLLLEKAVVNIMIAKGGGSFLLNVASAVFVVGVVLLFCYCSTGKFSVMEAIRSGSNGERFKAKNILRLEKQQSMKPVFYLAANDILTNWKKFVVLTVIFCIGTMMIILPLIAVNTLKDQEMLRGFNIVPSTAYLNNGRTEEYMVAEDETMVLNDMKHIKERLQEAGLDSLVWTTLGFFIPCYSSDSKEIFNYMSMKSYGDDGGNCGVLEGRLPEQENEVMVTLVTAEEMGVTVGDSIYFKMGGEDREFIVSGLYQAMMNMGNELRFGPQTELDYQYISGCLTIQVQILNDMDQKEVFAKITETLPDIEVETGFEFINKLVGDIVGQVDSLVIFLVGTVLIINCLITVLMMKTFLSREHGEVAMLKCLGFTGGAVRRWQTIRIVLILSAAILLGMLLSRILLPVTIMPIFAMMGAPRMKLVINPMEVFVWYPLLLVVVTASAAFVCSFEANKVDLREVNSLE